MAQSLEQRKCVPKVNSPSFPIACTDQIKHQGCFVHMAMQLSKPISNPLTSCQLTESFDKIPDMKEFLELNLSTEGKKNTVQHLHFNLTFT